MNAPGRLSREATRVWPVGRRAWGASWSEEGTSIIRRVTLLALRGSRASLRPPRRRQSGMREQREESSTGALLRTRHACFIPWERGEEERTATEGDSGHHNVRGLREGDRGGVLVGARGGGGTRDGAGEPVGGGGGEGGAGEAAAGAAAAACCYAGGGVRGKAVPDRGWAAAEAVHHARVAPPPKEGAVARDA